MSDHFLVRGTIELPAPSGNGAAQLGADGLRVLGGAFVHPGSTHGVLVQLSERK